MDADQIKTDQNSNVVEVALEVFFITEGDYIVSYCPSLELSSYGKTQEESKTAFEEALHIFITETQSRGTLDNIYQPFIYKPAYTQSIPKTVKRIS